MGIAVMLMALAGLQAAEGMPPVMVTMVPPAEIEGAPLRQPEGAGYLCASGYGECVRIERADDGSARIGIFDMDAAATPIDAAPLPPGIATDIDGAEISIWNRIVRLPTPNAAAGSATVYLVGVIRTNRAGYSGGGASAERLHLFQLTIAGGSAALGPEMASLPWVSSASIRACFGEDDTQRRQGACHDEYNYTPTLSILPPTSLRRIYPDLAYRTEATAYPRTSRRNRDSSEAAPLTAADLTIWRDPECSYTRTLRYNPASERYEMDRIAPDCSAYTLP